MEADWAKLAGRSEKQGNSIVVHSTGGEDYVIVIGPSEQGKFPKIKSAAIGFKDPEVSGWWRLAYLFSDSPSSTPLALVGALAFYKKVLADTSVSPAAEAVIKGYYEKESSNPKLVIADADEVRVKGKQDEKSPWLRAGYLTPPGADAVAWRSRLAGDDIIEELAKSHDMSEDDVRNKFAQAAEEGFTEAYAEEGRTGIESIPGDVEKDLIDAIKTADVRQIAMIFYEAAKEEIKPGKRPWPTSWITKNYDKMVETVIKALKQKTLQKSAINYLDDLVHAIFQREGRSDIYILEDALEYLEQTSPDLVKKLRDEFS